MSTILIPIPDTDFDPTEVAIPWKILRSEGHIVIFSTPEGKVGVADQRVVTGKGFGPLAGMLVADKNAQEAYASLIQDSNFLHPIPYAKIISAEYDAVVLPGGHAQGMKVYLESEILQKKITEFFAAKKIVGAICHGVLLAARSKTVTGESVLAGKKTTALPRWMELNAWAMTCLWLGNYYRTYPMTVQEEVTKAAGSFKTGPLSLQRDDLKHLSRGFVLRDGNYISARWPGDAHSFALEIAKALKN